jgi:hypothetical protein
MNCTSDDWKRHRARDIPKDDSRWLLTAGFINHIEMFTLCNTALQFDPSLGKWRKRSNRCSVSAVIPRRGRHRLLMHTNVMIGEMLAGMSIDCSIFRFFSIFDFFGPISLHTTGHARHVLHGAHVGSGDWHWSRCLPHGTSTNSDFPHETERRSQRWIGKPSVSGTSP